MSKQVTLAPKLFDYDGDLQKEWYVGFRYSCPECGIRIPKQIRLGINYLNTVKERSDEGNAVAELLAKALKDGWNPHHQEIKNFWAEQAEEQEEERKVLEQEENEISKMTMIGALNHCLREKKATLQPKSYTDFLGVVNFAGEAAKKCGLDNLNVTKVERHHIKKLLNQIGRDRQAAYDQEGKGKKWSGNSYNKYRGYLSTVFADMVDDVIKHNPCHNIANRPEIKTNIHRHATPKEEEAIKKHLQKVKRKFFIYLAFETLLGIRPKEIFGLRVCDWDMFNQAFDTWTKTRELRKVPVPNTLMKYIEELQLEKYPPEYYIFAHDFEPGKFKKKRDYGTKTWNELIIDGLGLKVSLYSFKGLGGEKKRDAGIDLQTVSKVSFGHTKVSTSKLYLHGERDRETQDIINNTPDF